MTTMTTSAKSTTVKMTKRRVNFSIVVLFVVIGLLWVAFYNKSVTTEHPRGCLTYSGADCVKVEPKTRKEEDKQVLVHSFQSTLKEPISWKRPKLPSRLQNADQTNPDLISHIRRFWIIPPFRGPAKINRTEGKPAPGRDYSEQNQPTIVNRLLRNKTDGFYVECGAADGLISSNSLFFELYHRWDGVLIEANPVFFGSLLEKRRRAFMLNACLSPTRRVMVTNFTLDGIAGGISERIPKGQRMARKSETRKHVQVQCFPLYSILAALGVKHVDYLSLDVEGPELDIIRTLPLNDVIIDVMTIETRIVGDATRTRSKTNDVIRLLARYGYHLVKLLPLDVVLSRLPVA